MNLRNGFPAALVHFLVALAVQLEIALGLVAPMSEGDDATLRIVALLPLLQLELLAVSLGVGALVALSWRPWPLRALAVLVGLSLTLLLVGDPIVYALGGGHYSLSMTEGVFPPLGHLWDSALAEASLFTYGVAIVAVVAFALVHAPRVHARLCALFVSCGRFAWRRRAFSMPLLTAWLGGALYVSTAHDPALLSRHPLVSLVLSMGNSARADGGPAERALAPGPPIVDPQCPPGVDLEAQRFGKPEPAPSFADVRATLASSGTKMNVVFIVLESVGALQLLERGAPRADAAPRMRALAERALVFDRLYDMFPGTVRSHVPLATGGRTVTWGGLYDELEATYRGPTLAAEFAKAGYRTALVSAQGLDFENLGHFYRQMPWQYLVEPDKTDDASIKAARLNSWGIAEAKAKDLALAWLRGRAREGEAAPTAPAEPFFLQFLTSGTHHPYSVPKGYEGPRRGASRKSRYLNALHYADKIIGELADALRAMGVFEQTLIAVVGDHGQAFGDLHKGNLGHKNHLYEENIRNFLIVADPRVNKGRVSSRAGYVGDVAPTLLALAKLPAAGMPGKDLTADPYKEQLRYFHKNSHPARFGLVDGSWKYISGLRGPATVKLFDLASDPGEQRDVSAAHVDRIPLYDCLLRRWYLTTNDDYLRWLRGFALMPNVRLRDADITTPGPKVVLFGRREGKKRFAPREALSPYDRVIAFSEWSPEHRKKDAYFVWTSPSQKSERKRFVMQPDWSRVWFPHDGELPLETGTWTMTVREAPKGPDLARGTFVVDPRATPFDVRTDMPRRMELDVDEPRPTSLLVEVHWKGDKSVNERESYRVALELVGPKGKKHRREVYLADPPRKVRIVPETPLRRGTWRLVARTLDGKRLATKRFAIR